MTVDPVSIPGEGPNRVNAPEDYDQQTADYRAAFNTTVQEFNVSAGQFNADVVAFNALGAQVLAAQSAVFNEINAPVWVSGGNYTAVESTVISPLDLMAYRAVTTHSAETTDPSLDVTNWKLAVGAGYAPILSPVFTGTPTAPTAALGDSSLQIVNTQHLQNALDAFVQRPLQYANVTSDAAAVIFEMTGHEAYRLVISNVVAVNSDDILQMFFGDSAANFFTDQTYQWQRFVNNTFTQGGNGGTLATSLSITDQINNSGNTRGLNMVFDIYPAPAGDRMTVVYGRGAVVQKMFQFSGTMNAASRTSSHVRLNFLGSDIAQGKFFLFPLTEVPGA